MNSSPLVGKTYSLQNATAKSDAYYEQIRSVTDEFLHQGLSLDNLLSIVQRASRNKRKLRSFPSGSANGSVESRVIGTLGQQFSGYTVNVASHLRELGLLRSWDRTLATVECQYHLYMLEIELVNRVNANVFRRCTTKLAFLPHCLHDLKADCHKAIRGDDYVCKGCTKECRVNAVSKLLRRHGVTPYIWMTANLKSLFKRLRSEGESVCVLGIACIPELVNGMRMCARAGIPVVGIPLDANRCARWWGEFYPNFVNLAALENLLGSETLLRPIRLKNNILS